MARTRSFSASISSEKRVSPNPKKVLASSIGAMVAGASWGVSGQASEVSSELDFSRRFGVTGLSVDDGLD